MTAHLPDRFRHASVWLGALALAFTLTSCQRVPLTAPSGTAITLVSSSNVLPVNGQIDITAVLIEGGFDAGSGSATGTTTAGVGTPVHNGTVVTFTTTLGRLEPAEAKTTSGRATTRLVADGRSGVATVTAFSGAATKTLEVNVGAAAASRIAVTANPQSLPGTGGTTAISARVEDLQGNGLGGVPVSFSTTKGTLSSTTVTSNDQGVATTTLTTTLEATVTATAGGSTAAVTGTVTVSVKPRTTVAIGAPTSATVAVPATFSVTPGTGAIITNVVVDFGDGTSAPLGAITAATNIVHVFRSASVFTVQATATDSEGGTGTSSTQIAVAPLTVALTFSPNSSTAPRLAEVVTFTATPTTGALIQSYEWNFGDTFSSVSTSSQVTHSFGAPGSYVVSVRAVPTGGGAGTTQLVTVDVKP